MDTERYVERSVLSSAVLNNIGRRNVVCGERNFSLINIVKQAYGPERETRPACGITTVYLGILICKGFGAALQRAKDGANGIAVAPPVRASEQLDSVLSSPVSGRACGLHSESGREPERARQAASGM